MGKFLSGFVLPILLLTGNQSPVWSFKVLLDNFFILSHLVEYTHKFCIFDSLIVSDWGQESFLSTTRNF